MPPNLAEELLSHLIILTCVHYSRWIVLMPPIKVNQSSTFPLKCHSIFWEKGRTRVGPWCSWDVITSVFSAQSVSSLLFSLGSMSQVPIKAHVPLLQSPSSSHQWVSGQRNACFPQSPWVMMCSTPTVIFHAIEAHLFKEKLLKVVMALNRESSISFVLVPIFENMNSKSCLFVL